MTFTIEIDQRNADQAIELLQYRGFSFIAGTSEHNDDCVIYLHGLIGDLYSAESILKNVNLF